LNLIYHVLLKNGRIRVQTQFLFPESLIPNTNYLSKSKPRKLCIPAEWKLFCCSPGPCRGHMQLEIEKISSLCQPGSGSKLIITDPDLHKVITVLRIRIFFIRIRIQHFDNIRIRIRIVSSPTRFLDVSHNQARGWLNE